MEVILDNNILNFILESEFSVTFNNYVKENKIKLFIVDMKIDMFFTLCDDFFALFLFSDDREGRQGRADIYAAGRTRNRPYE